MKGFFLLLLIYSPFSSLSQDNGIYVKFESKTNKQKVATYYVSGQKYVQSSTISVPTRNFIWIRFNECVPSQINLDGYGIVSYLTAGLLCSDSVIINIDNGHTTIINREYIEYEQNYWYHLRQYYSKRNFQPRSKYWNSLQQQYKIEKEFLDQAHNNKIISGTFYEKMRLDLPYKINNYILRAPLIYTSVVKDSLITCKWNKDSLINTESYLDYVIGYINYFELPRLQNGPVRDSAFFYYAYSNTSGRLREELCYYQLTVSNSYNNPAYLKQFEVFKTINKDATRIKSIEEKITNDKREALLRQ